MPPERGEAILYFLLSTSALSGTGLSGKGRAVGGRQALGFNPASKGHMAGKWPTEGRNSLAASPGP